MSYTDKAREGRKSHERVSIGLSDGTRRSLLKAINFFDYHENHPTYHAHQVMQETLERLCGTLNREVLTDPTGFGNASLAARDLRYVMGSLVAEADQAEDERGVEYHKKYPKYNSALRKGLSALHLDQDTIENMLVELEYQASAAGISFNGSVSR